MMTISGTSSSKNVIMMFKYAKKHGRFIIWPNGNLDKAALLNHLKSGFYEPFYRCISDSTLWVKLFELLYFLLAFISIHSSLTHFPFQECSLLKL